MCLGNFAVVVAFFFFFKLDLKLAAYFLPATFKVGVFPGKFISKPR